MKLFGSIKELVSAVFRKNSQEITLRPNQSTTYTAARDVQLPPIDGNDVIVGASATQSLSNKTIGSGNTLSGATASNFVNGGTVTLPSSTDTLVGRNTTDTLTNKTLGSTNNLSGATASSFSNGGTVTLPSSGTLATLAGTETLSNKSLTSSSTTFVNGAKSIRVSPGGVGDVLTTLESTSSVARTIQLPNASDTLVGLATSDTLTNKNLTSSTNTLSGATATGFTNGGTVSLPSGTTTLLGNNTSQVVTNKDIDG